MALALALGGVVVAGAEPVGPPALSTEGGTIVYTARSGDTPARVAEMFGIPPEQFSAFLRANGITDAARVPAGFRYRVPNPLAARVSALEAQAAKLEHEAQASAERAQALEAELEQKRRTNLAERQESARRILALEERIRELERPRGPSTLVSVK